MAESIKIEGDEELILKLRAMRNRARDLRPAFRRFEEHLHAHQMLRFQTEGAFAGSKWKPLSPAYAAFKLKAVGPKPILQFSGRLMASFTSHSPDTISEIGPTEARFGSRVSYAAVHQFGRKDGSMPARPPLVVNEVLRNEANRIISEHVIGEET